MGYVVKEGDSLPTIARLLLGDARLTHELHIPGWKGDGDPPPGTTVYLKTEQMGPPAKDATKTQVER